MVNAPFDNGIETEKSIPGPHVATHFSEETAAARHGGEKQKEVETVKWKSHSQVNVT